MMKAAEEGHTEILKMLSGRRANLEVTNRKGRGALSFAAAPSMGRPTPTAALELLLEAKADMHRVDADGMTAKGAAMREKRGEAVTILKRYEGR